MEHWRWWIKSKIWTLAPRFFGKLHNIQWVLSHFEYAWRLVQDSEIRKQDVRQVGYALEETALPRYGAFNMTRTVSHIGSALWIADQFGIQLHMGTGFSDCRAVLTKDKWKNDISLFANPWSYSLFHLEDPKDVDMIQGISRWPEVAIARCLFSARSAGVI